MTFQPVPISDGSGVIYRASTFPSQIFEPRTVDIWLPPGYSQDPRRRFPVIYMHDGQNLFDPAIAFTGTDWGVDEAILRLVQAGLTSGAIVVGIWNGALRWPDYMPQRLTDSPQGGDILSFFLQEKGGRPRSDRYLQFLVQEVKPAIDSAFRTLPDAPHTFVMGSSMGGLASLYALQSYPQVFGAAGCLSTHWPAGGDLLVDDLAAHLPPPGSHRLYFDYGTATLDALYEPFQLRFDDHLRNAGYTQGKDWVTLKFEGAEHNEAAWRRRVEIPLRFLLVE
jgi:predicted alpha/beta superfamily hydrolase